MIRSRDIETINLELIFSDLEVLERRIAKAGRTRQMDKAASKGTGACLKEIKKHLEDGQPAKTL